MDILIDGYGVECWEYTGDVHQIFIHDYINILVRRKERGLKIDKAVKKVGLKINEEKIEIITHPNHTKRDRKRLQLRTS